MRMWHRFQILMLLLTATTTTCSAVRAQEMMGSPYGGAPAFMAGQGGYPGASGQGVPPGFLPHPNIAPFENSFEQHYNSDGLWFKRVIGGMSPMNDYYFNVDWTTTRTRKMRGLVGDPMAPTFVQTAANPPTPPVPSDRDAAVTFPDVNFLPMFPRHDSRVTGALSNSGIRLSGGVHNKVGWRFSWNVGYDGDSSDVYDARKNREGAQLRSIDATFLNASNGIVPGNGSTGLQYSLKNVTERQIVEQQILNTPIFDTTDTRDFGAFGSTFDILDRQLYPYGSIGLQTGLDLNDPRVDPLTNIEVGGVRQLFDLDFIIRHSLETYGAGFHFASSPMYESGSLQIRPLVGARFFRVYEGFHFRGADSGLAYDANQPDGIDDDGDFVTDNVAEDGQTNFVDPIIDNSDEIIIRSFVNNQVRSTMAGPEAGIEYEVARRKGVRFTGSTRVGALINTERMRLNGDNIGDPFAVDLNGVTTQMFDTSTENGQLSQNAFSSTMTTTHVSPLFEQQLNAEVPIFSRIPVLRDVWQLEGAKLRLGWKYTWIGEVANPTQSIVWTANPQAGLFPTLKTERESFWQNQFNVGINWEY